MYMDVLNSVDVALHDNFSTICFVSRLRDNLTWQRGLRNKACSLYLAHTVGTPMRAQILKRVDTWGIRSLYTFELQLIIHTFLVLLCINFTVP